MIEQWGIAFFGVVAVALSQDHKASRRRYACLFGLAGQPFWFYAAWHSQQWGIGLITVFYTLAWSRGVWFQWLRSDRHRVTEKVQECRDGGGVCCTKMSSESQGTSVS